MLSLDVSKVLPVRAYSYLAALIPGLFFESSILLANPELISKLAAKSQDGFALGHYTTLGISLFLAFVVGNGVMMLVGLIQLLLGYLYRLGSFLWKQLCSWVFLPLLTWLLGKPTWRSPWMIRLHRYAQGQRFPSGDDLKPILGCLHAFTRQLLKTRYGIKPEDLGPDDWLVLYWALATPTREEMRGSVLMIATHATGWCGLAATRFAPALNNRYYLSFSLLMIVVGLVHDFYVAKRINHPVISRLLNLRGLLREFRKIPNNEVPHPEPDAEPEANEG